MFATEPKRNRIGWVEKAGDALTQTRIPGSHFREPIHVFWVLAIGCIGLSEQEV